jgi:fatty acid desaturase
VSHRHHRGPRRRGSRKRGFSRNLSRQWYDMLGIPREQKRGFFNMLAKNVVGAFAITAGALGFVEGGLLGALVGLVAGALFGLWFVVEERMFR